MEYYLQVTWGASTRQTLEFAESNSRGVVQVTTGLQEITASTWYVSSIKKMGLCFQSDALRTLGRRARARGNVTLNLL